MSYEITNQELLDDASAERILLSCQDVVTGV